jgi:glycerol-3-phosphate acyltransferase PlsY
MTATPIICALIGYVLGAIPFGILLTWAFGAGDLRTIGSGNIGATNVLRTGRKGLAAATLLLDGGKGAVAVLVARHFTHDEHIAAIAGFAAFGGHLFPVWLNFRGGKGVATMLGVTLAAWWPAGVAALLVWLTGALVTRYSSVGGMLAALAAPVIFAGGLATGAAWLPPGGLRWLVVFAAMAALLLLKHADNIRRLRSGTEGKIGAKPVAAATPIGHNGGPALDDRAGS